jgi:hypothetical protein
MSWSEELWAQKLFSNTRESAFVRNKEKDVVFQELLDNFKKNSLPCLPKSSFTAALLAPDTGISRKTATNTVPLSVMNIPDRPVGKSLAVVETFF